jgi:hypothetical protein
MGEVVHQVSVRRVDPPLPDVLLGVSGVVVDQVGRVGHVVIRVAGPGAKLLLDAPFAPPGLRPVRLVEALARRGRLERTATRRALDHLVATMVPALVAHVAALVPVTDLVRRHVDLDALVADVDLDAATAGLDLDALAERIDVEAILDRIDLTDLVMRRVDLDAVVRGVDLDAAVGTVDLDAIVDRLDLEALANDVIAAIDLPGIIRASSGSIASETVRGVRLQSIDADRAVDRLVDRLRARRHAGPGGPQPGGATT